jgi:hypothetical protein
MEFVPNEKAFTQRAPSTANLMVDSKDRGNAIYPLCNDFLIARDQSILNGFFTRIGVTEVVMDWKTPNVSAAAGGIGNNFLTYNVSATAQDLFLPTGFYNVQQSLNAIVRVLNDASGGTGASGLVWSVAGLIGSGAVLAVTNTSATIQNFSIAGDIIYQLGAVAVDGVTKTNFISGVVGPGSGVQVSFLPSRADLRPARYVDIVCTQLTNNQSVKDASTARIVRDVLCRWYFDYDNQGPVDDYGFPILMGYNAFCLRRTYSPPKQIQWQTNVPIGQMVFQLYGNGYLDGSNRGLQIVNRDTDFLMTLQVSEN